MKSVSRDVENNETTQRLLATLRDHFGSVNCVRWAKHGRYVASGSDDQVILVHERKPGSGTTEFGSGEPPDVENWKVVMTLRGHTADVVTFASFTGVGVFGYVDAEWAIRLLLFTNTLVFIFSLKILSHFASHKTCRRLQNALGRYK